MIPDRPRDSIQAAIPARAREPGDRYTPAELAERAARQRKFSEMRNAVMDGVRGAWSRLGSVGDMRTGFGRGELDTW